MRRISRKLAVITTFGVIAGVIGFTATPAPAAPIAYTTLSTDGCQLATIDLATGDTTALSAPPSGAACVDDLAVAPDGTVYGISDFVDSNTSATLVTFDPTTGAPVTTVPFSGDFDESFTAHGGLAIDANGVMYASFTTNEDGCSDFGANEVFSCLYVVDPATAAATLIGPSGFEQVRMFWLTTNCAGDMLTGLQSNDLQTGLPAEVPTSTEPDVEGTEGDPPAPAEVPDPADSFADDVDALTTGLDLASVDEATGTVTDGPLLDDVRALEWAPENGPLYAIGDIGESGFVFTVDPATGDMTQVAPIEDVVGGFIENLAMAVTCPIVVAFTG
jgi:hypothetical protein